jgi:PPOX class probable F420-dependent enzyme
LASAKYLLVTTLAADGTLVSAPAQAVVDGDSAYIRTWRPSGTWKRVQRTGWAQLTPCTRWGLCRYGQTVDATLRQMGAEETSRAAAKLARKYPLRRGFVSSFCHGLKRWPTVYYRLQADCPADEA